MSWLFDLGNTRLKWAVADASGIVERGAIAHGTPGFEAEVNAVLETLPRTDRALLASVAGADLAARVGALVARFGVVCEPVRTQACFGGVTIAYAEPARLGVDRFLSLLGARQRGDGPWLLASVGTALTLDLLGSDGTHLGGLIAPSPTLMRDALEVRAPQLRTGDGTLTDFATDTASALASGCNAAALALIERSHGDAARRLGGAPTLLVAGGGAEALLPHLRVGYRAAPDLVLEGLAVYARA